MDLIVSAPPPMHHIVLTVCQFFLGRPCRATCRLVHVYMLRGTEVRRVESFFFWIDFSDRFFKVDVIKKCYWRSFFFWGPEDFINAVLYQKLSPPIPCLPLPDRCTLENFEHTYIRVLQKFDVWKNCFLKCTHPLSALKRAWVPPLWIQRVHTTMDPSRACHQNVYNVCTPLLCILRVPYMYMQ
jgi:hypothetical protein